MKYVVVTIDVEPDYPPILGKSYLGIDNAVPRLLDLFQSEKIPATFFMMAELCEPYPSLAREIGGRGFHLGSHGLNHVLLCSQDKEAQWRVLSESTKILEKSSGSRITSFRAPNFSIGGHALSCLEKLGYRFDSSILPGRRLRKRLSGTVYDFRGAPKLPYHPSLNEITHSGNSSILELPVTENPLYRQRPIGAGFLNIHGPAETLRAIEMTGLAINVMVVHPWELVDLCSRFPNAPSWMRKGCRSDVPALSKLFDGLRRRGYGFMNLEQAAKSHSDISPEIIVA